MRSVVKKRARVCPRLPASARFGPCTCSHAHGSLFIRQYSWVDLKSAQSTYESCTVYCFSVPKVLYTVPLGTVYSSLLGWGELVWKTTGYCNENNAAVTWCLRKEALVYVCKFRGFWLKRRAWEKGRSLQLIVTITVQAFTDVKRAIVGDCQIFPNCTGEKGVLNSAQAHFQMVTGVNGSMAGPLYNRPRE